MEIKKRGISLIGHPALVDKGEYCSLEVFDDPGPKRPVISSTGFDSLDPIWD